jgi:hypothetical protein
MHKFCVAVLEPVTQKWPESHVPFGAVSQFVAQNDP